MFDHAEGMVFRPPSEANSFILRVTIGCAHNRCTFCSMYRDVQFRARPISEIEPIILKTARHYPDLRRVFLADGDALVLSTHKLLEIMELLKAHFPKLSRITCYGGPLDILRKSPEELLSLKQAGIEDFTWHDLRHTWASWLVQRGVSLRILQEMGGWKTLAMVQRYAHLAPEHLHEHAEILQSLVGTDDTNRAHRRN